MALISFISFLSSFLFALILTPMVRRLALKLDASKHKSVPHLGGLAVFAACFSVSLPILLHQSLFGSELLAIWIASTVIVLLGVIDDFVELSPAGKFFGQALVTIILIVFGVVTSIAAIGKQGNILLTLLWMFAIINAFNLLDIMDGLASGIAAIAALGLLVVAMLSGNLLAAVLCASLMGAAIGFLKYNLPPAKIYLGDTGSMFLGFVLATIAVIVDYAPAEREIALLTPIVVLGLPIFDTAFVILMRILHRRSVIRKSRDHFALRLVNAGLSEPRALLVMYIFGIFFAGSSLLISRVSNQQGVVVLSVIALICYFALHKIGAVKVDE